jgi:hypothetical protein
MIPWTQIWASDVRKIDGLWGIASLHEQDDGAKLQLDVGVSVANEHDINESDVAIELYAGKRRIYCDAIVWDGFTETGSITAQLSAHCDNSKLALPTRVVVAIRGVRETFDVRLSSLTTPI